MHQLLRVCMHECRESLAHSYGPKWPATRRTISATETTPNNRRQPYQDPRTVARHTLGARVFAGAQERTNGTEKKNPRNAGARLFRRRCYPIKLQLAKALLVPLLTWPGPLFHASLQCRYWTLLPSLFFMEKVTLDFLCSQLHVLTILYNFIHQCTCWHAYAGNQNCSFSKKKIARCFQTDPSTQPLILALLKVWSKQNRRQDSTMAVVRQLARACSCRGAERTTGTEILDAAGRWLRRCVGDDSLVVVCSLLVDVDPCLAAFLDPPC